LSSINCAIGINFARYFAIWGFDIGKDASFNWVANISGTWVLVITNFSFSDTVELFGDSINNTVCRFTSISSNTFLDTFVKPWITFRIVDQNCFTCLGVSIANSFLAVIIEAVLGSKFKAINFGFTYWGITSSDGLVKLVNTSLNFVARINSTFVVIVTYLSAVFAGEFLVVVISTGGLLASIGWLASSITSLLRAFESVRNSGTCSVLFVTNRGEASSVNFVVQSPLFAIEILDAISLRWALSRDGISVNTFSGCLIARVNGTYLSVITFVYSTNT